MKKIKVLALVAFGVGLVGLNYAKSDVETVSNMSFDNIKALQASAGEAWCDNTTTNNCKITLPNGTILEGVGQPHSTWP